MSVFIRYLRARKQLASGSSKGWFLLAWSLSLFFHPLLIPTWMVLLLMKFSPGLMPFTEEGYKGMIAFIFGGTFLLPASGIALLWASGMVRSLSMDDKQDRHLPHLLTFACYLTGAILFHRFLPMLDLLYCVMLGSAVSVGVTGLITLFWKISSHMAGLGGLLGFQLAMAIQSNPHDFIIPMFLSILFTGAVASSRLFLRVHNEAQILAGFFLGMVISSITVTFFAAFF